MDSSRYESIRTTRSTSQGSIRFPPIHSINRTRPFSASNTSGTSNNNNIVSNGSSSGGTKNRLKQSMSSSSSSSVSSWRPPSPTFLTGLPYSSTPSSCQSSSRRSSQSSSSSLTRRNSITSHHNRNSRPNSTSSIMSNESDMVNYGGVFDSRCFTDSVDINTSSLTDGAKDAFISPDRTKSSQFSCSSASMRLVSKSTSGEEGAFQEKGDSTENEIRSLYDSYHNSVHLSSYGSKDFMGAEYFETSKQDFLQSNFSNDALNILYCDKNSEASLFLNASYMSSSIVVDPTDFLLIDGDEEDEDVVEFEAARSSVSQAMSDYSQRQDAIRSELETYLIHMKERTDDDGEKLIKFDNYEQRVNQLASDVLNAPTEVSRIDLLYTSPEVARQLVHATHLSYQEAAKKITKEESLDSAIEKIRKLDMVLKEKAQIQEKLSQIVLDIVSRDRQEKQEREVLKKNIRQQLREKLEQQERLSHSNQTGTHVETDDDCATHHQASLSITSSRSSASGTDSPFSNRNITMGADARYYSLSEIEQQRVAEILSDSTFDAEEDGIVVPLGVGFTPSETQRDRLVEINNQLIALKPDDVDGLVSDLKAGEFRWQSNDSTSHSSGIIPDDSTIQTRKGIDYLRMNRIERAQKQRLSEISEKIADLYRGYNEMMTADECSTSKCALDQITLTALLEQCRNEERLILEKRVMSDEQLRVNGSSRTSHELIDDGYLFTC